MRSPVTSRILPRAAAIVLLGTLLCPVTAFAQNAVEDCIEQGYRPGTIGFYQCLQSAAAGQESTGPEVPDTGDAGSNVNGNPDEAGTDYSGASMEGATAPDPNILKQLNAGHPPKQ